MSWVKVYTTPNCRWCRAAKEFLRQNEVLFEEIDVSRSSGGVVELAEKPGRFGLPVIDIGGEIITGFDKDAIGRALNEKIFGWANERGKPPLHNMQRPGRK
jgi:glutaredoxin